jgi:hypothetical protein
MEILFWECSNLTRETSKRKVETAKRGTRRHEEHRVPFPFSDYSLVEVLVPGASIYSATICGDRDNESSGNWNTQLADSNQKKS